MKIDEAFSAIADRIMPQKNDKLGNAIKVAAGTAAALWMVLRLRRELYGPGGTKMSPYDPDVDKVWNEDDKS